MSLIRIKSKENNQKKTTRAVAGILLWICWWLGAELGELVMANISSSETFLTFLSILKTGFIFCICLYSLIIIIIFFLIHSLYKHVPAHWLVVK